MVSSTLVMCTAPNDGAHHNTAGFCPLPLASTNDRQCAWGPYVTALSHMARHGFMWQHGGGILATGMLFVAAVISALQKNKEPLPHS